MYPQYFLLSWIILISSSIGQSADSNVYLPVGCFRDLQAVPRPLPELIHNYRLNNELDWLDLNKTVIEPCAQKARQKGYLYFGIQYYGECWSGPNAHASYMRDGDSSSCVSGVGRAFANMVYRLVGEEKECENYKTLDSIDRSALYTTIGDYEDWLCDNNLHHGWYRFEGQAGNEMANFPIEKNKCQTKVGRWFGGQYPNITQGIVKSFTCSGSSKQCNEKRDMFVRNCGKFYVYKLDPVRGCAIRYCGNGKKSPSVTVEI